MGWETVPATTRARTDRPALSIARNGRIAWNRGMFEALGEPAFVELLIDTQGHRIGLRAAHEAPATFKVRKATKQDTWGISAGGALRNKGTVPARAFRRWASDYGDGVWGISTEGMQVE